MILERGRVSSCSVSETISHVAEYHKRERERGVWSIARKI
jgi:hypothetical protein